MGNRYINADALLNAIEENCQTQYQGDPWYGREPMYLVDDVIECINEAPTADVRPNVMGEWEIYDYEYDGEDEHPIIKCSRCGYLPPEEMDTYNFCPNCGADMIGEEHTMEEYMMGQEGNPDDGSL